jgi:uncharacterized membrane protein HdeD (DUF308 family)
MTSTHIDSRPPLAGVALLRTMADNWWLVLLRGIAAIAFGILAFAWPVITLLTLTLLWGAYAVVDGLCALWGAVAGPRGHMGARFWLIIVGLAGVVAGLLAFAWPGVTALVLLFFIAIWAIVIGVMQIWGAIQLRKEMEGEWLLILSGLVSVAFGILLLARPGLGALAVVWMIGWFAILEGCLLVALSLRLRKHKHAA